MKGEWSCYGGGQFKTRENSYVTEAACLMEGEWPIQEMASFKEGEWSSNRSGQFNRGKMVMVQRWLV